MTGQRSGCRLLTSTSCSCTLPDQVLVAEDGVGPVITQKLYKYLEATNRPVKRHGAAFIVSSMRELFDWLATVHTVPARMFPYFKRDEIPPLVMVRRHPLVILGPIALLLIGFIVALILTTAVVPGHGLA